MNRYEKGTWLDAIVDANGNVIQAGTVIRKEDLDRIEAGIETSILNAVPTIRTTGTAAALKLRDDRITANNALWDGYAAKAVLHTTPTSSATLQINGRPAVSLGVKAKAGDVIYIIYNNSQLIIRQVGGGASEAADVTITSGLAQKIGCAANVEAALTEVNEQLSVVAARDPDTADTGYAPGRQWVNSQTGGIWVMTPEGWVCGQAYDGQMQTFFAIPGATGKIRLKIQMPDDADGVTVRYKSTAWANGTDSHQTGTLAVNTQQNYYGDNVWYEITGLTDGQEYYFAAFPYKGQSFNDDVTADNTTLCRAGGLLLEYTFDSDTGTTINDTSGNGIHGTVHNNVTHAAGIVGNAVVGDGVSAYVSTPSVRLDLPNKTICCFAQFRSAGSAHKYAFTADSSTSFKNGGYNLEYGLVQGSITFHLKGNAGRTYSDKITDRSFYCGKHTGNACKIRRNNDVWTSVTGDNATSNQPSNPMYLLASRTPDRYGDCIIDQLRIYNRELADYEVDNIYNDGKGC